MSELEVAAHWTAAGAYALASLAAGLGVCFSRRLALAGAAGLLVAGLGAHALALGLRWAGTGHAPFLGRYEAFSSYALVVLAVYLLLQWRAPALRPGLAVVAPIGFLLLGAALLSPAAPTYPSPALRSPWLTIHVSVAKLALATAVAGGAVSLLGLLEHRRGPIRGKAGLVLERLAQQLLAYTFFLVSVVLLSGSLWASAAWGSFWSWDPVETWSLTFWAACALVLHLRQGLAWSGPRWSGSVLALTALAVVTFVGYGHFGVSIHAAYVAP